MHGGVALAPYPSVPVGQRCRVTGGPLQDLEGIVVAHAATARLVLQVRMLGQGALVEIDAGLIEPFTPAGAHAGAEALATCR
jgi:hypothetical protein